VGRLPRRMAAVGQGVPVRGVERAKQERPGLYDQTNHSASGKGGFITQQGTTMVPTALGSVPESGCCPTPHIAARMTSMNRSAYPTRVIRPGEREPTADDAATTPEERFDMMWPLVVDTWAFMGKPLDESRLQRHVVRVVRGKR